MSVEMTLTERRSHVKKSRITDRELFEASDDMEYAFAVFRCYYPTKTDEAVREIVKTCYRDVFGTNFPAGEGLRY